MKNRKTKLLSLALALTLGAVSTVWADGNYGNATSKQDVSMTITDSNSTTTVNGATASGGGNTTTTITGTIVATQLKVTVPTTVGFDIDPTITAANPASQISAQSGNITITNQSIVPIYVKVSNVAVAATVGTKPKLVTTWADADQNMMFALKKTQPTNFTTATDWLTEGTISGNYYLDSSAGKLAATGKTGNSVTMKIYGRIGQGWSAGDQFTITPTFTVGVKPYS